ncbi:MAG: hypothetical protein JNM88_12275 [Chitinophagaceae bacterium]|nr:hypothetical protein [Chitinophagaceae bacterium]
MKKTSTWISAFFKKTGELLRRLFIRGKKNGPEVKKTVTDESSLDNEKFYDEYSEKVRGFDDIHVKMGLHDRISASQKYMYEMGRRDGSLGVQLFNLPDIAMASAQELFRHVYVIVKGKLASLRSVLNAKTRIKENDEALYKREQVYNNYTKFQYRFFPRAHSLWLCFIYFIVALILIMADIPFALTLIQKGLGLSTGPEKYSFPQLFMNNKLQNVLAYSWETVITALGVAMCTIYIKIYYDEFIGTPYANRLMVFRRFIEENGFQNTKELEEEINKEKKAKDRWKTGIFFFTILSILMLALFRYSIIVKHSLIDVTSLTRVALVTISMLFPVIGGICLSYALTNFQNLRRMKKSDISYDKSRKKWQRAEEEVTIIEKDYNDIAAAYSSLENEDDVTKAYAEYLLAFYQRGYAIGGMQPDKYIRGEDFFTKVMEWRNIAISRKINKHINTLN